MGSAAGKEGQRNDVISSNIDLGHFAKANKDTQTTAGVNSGQSYTQSDVKFGLSNEDFLPSLSPQNQRLRHLSNKSLDAVQGQESGSDRSTPEILPSDNPLWDGKPTLVGNIVCIIPKSAMPYVPVTSSAASGSPGKDENESKVTRRKIKSTSGAHISVPESPIRTISLDEGSLSKPSSSAGGEEGGSLSTGSVEASVRNTSRIVSSEESNKEWQGSGSTAVAQLKGNAKIPFSR